MIPRNGRKYLQQRHWEPIWQPQWGNMLIPILLVAFGGTGSAHAYFMTAVIFAVVGCSLYLTCFGLVREHVQAPTEKVQLCAGIQISFTNKPLFCIMITNLVINLAFIMKMTLNYYYTTYTLGRCKADVADEPDHPAEHITGNGGSAFLTKLVGKKKDPF